MPPPAAESPILDSLNQDAEPWLAEGYTLSDYILSRATLAAHDEQEYSELAMAYEGVDVLSHPMHDLLFYSLKAAREAGKTLVVVWPPGHGKTLNLAKYVIWTIGNKIAPTWAFTAAAEAIAKRNLIHARKTLCSPLTAHIWPGLKPDRGRSMEGGGWSMRSLHIEGQRDPAITAWSLRSEVAGLRVHGLWLDDVITQACKSSAAIRQQSHGDIHETWLTRLVPSGGLVIWSNNCWHRDDSVHRALRSEAFMVLWMGYEGTERIYWRVYNHPKGSDLWDLPTTGVMPLWDGCPETRLQQIMSQDEPAFKRLYGQNAVVADDARFPPAQEWVTYNPRVDLPRWTGGVQVVAFLDPCGGKHVDRNDYAAITCGVMGADRVFYVLAVWVARCSPGEQVAALYDMDARVKQIGYPSGITTAEIEVLAKDELWIKDALDEHKAARRRSREPSAMVVNMFNPIHNKHTRIERLHGPLTTGLIRWPAHFRDSALQKSRDGNSWRLMIEQIEDFPPPTSQDHDDAPDSLEGAYRLALQKIEAGDRRQSVPMYLPENGWRGQV